MQSKVWLIPLVDGLFGAARSRADGAEQGAEQAAGSPSDAAFDPWLDAELCARGYDRGLLTDRLAELGAGADSADFRRYSLQNHTAHCLDLGLRWLHRSAAPDSAPESALDPVRDPLRLLAALALAHDVDPDRLDGDPEPIAERALALVDEDPRSRRFVRALNAVAARLGARLIAAELPADHPLTGHPFHQLLRAVEARCFARVLRCVAVAPDGRPAPEDLLRAHGLARATLHHALSAAIALAAADGEIDPGERALIEALLRAARFDDAAIELHRAEFDDPAPPEALAARLDDPATRHLVLRLLFLAAHVDGRYPAAERAFIERFAAAAGEPPEALVAYEAQALAGYEARPDLIERLSLQSTVGRLRRRITDGLDRAVRDNSRRLWTEVQQTGELVTLLARARHTALTPAEDAAVRAQLIDIAKAIPALALFAVPGGSILLPLLIRHLPFNVLPSSFQDEARLTLDHPAIDLPAPIEPPEPDTV